MFSEKKTAKCIRENQQQQQQQYQQQRCEKTTKNLWKINWCISRQWYLYVIDYDDKKKRRVHDLSTKKTYRCMTDIYYFNLNDSEWIFNQTNILFIYHLIRSKSLLGFGQFHLFNYSHSIFLHCSVSFFPWRRFHLIFSLAPRRSNKSKCIKT